jgi:biofilm protein TabA
MALYGSLETVRAQAPRTAGFVTAFNYVEELLRAGSPVQQRVRAIASGDSQKIELSGGAFVIEQVYETKLRADGFFESHRKFIDVQTVFEGEETMEVADIARMTLRQPYNAERDLVVYTDSTDASLLRVFPGQLAVFFPSDVHMPTLRIRHDAVLVRKCVIKVPVETAA